MNRARSARLAGMSAEVGREHSAPRDVTNVTNPVYRREGEIEDVLVRPRARMLVPSVHVRIEDALFRRVCVYVACLCVRRACGYSEISIHGRDETTDSGA